MEQINAAIRSYRQTRNEKDFKKVYEYCLPDFKFWYRHVQRHTDLDRASLLCEFQYIVLRAMMRFDPSSPVPDGFIRYFRAATKKHSLTLRRKYAGTIKCHSLKQDWEVVDPKAHTDIEDFEILDAINVCLTKNERAIVLSRLGGCQTDEVKESLKLSEFQYRAAVRNIKASQRLARAFLRD